MREACIALAWIIVAAAHYFTSAHAHLLTNLYIVASGVLTAAACWWVNRDRRKACRHAQAELHRYKATLAEYRRWLAICPEADATLWNLQSELEGKRLNAIYPPSVDGGPWTLPNLRELLLIRRQKYWIANKEGRKP